MAGSYDGAEGCPGGTTRAYGQARLRAHTTYDRHHKPNTIRLGSHRRDRRDRRHPLRCGAGVGRRPNQGPGGPILVVTGDSNPFGRYYAEILRNEGLNEFDVTDLSDVTAVLAAHDVVILGETPLTAGEARCSPTGSTTAAT